MAFPLPKFVVGALALALCSASAHAANALPVALLKPVTPSAPPPGGSTAVATSSDYAQMQAGASEVVVLRVTGVKTQEGKPADNNVGANPLMVSGRAAVLSVIRSASGLKVGSVIYLIYGYAPPAPGVMGPTPIPIIKENTEYTAYLTGGPDNNPYFPAAGAKSFIDNSAPVANSSSTKGAATPTGPTADPALLPTPDNPSPPGATRLTHDNLAQFAKTIQASGHWGVSIANADALPLHTEGTSAPVLEVFYSPSLHAIATQPGVLVYQAGTVSTPGTGNQTIERALIMDANHQFLGDALWAQRPADGQKPSPLPIWHWFSYKVEIEDPATHQVQTILLSARNKN